MAENAVSTISVNGTSRCGLEYAIVKGYDCYAMSYYGRNNITLSNQLRYVAGNQNLIYIFPKGRTWAQKFSIKSEAEKSYRVQSIKFVANAEHMGKSVAVRKDVGTDIIITDNENYVNDMYNAFMNKFSVGIKPEWVDFIIKTGIRDNRIYRFYPDVITGDMGSMYIDLPDGRRLNSREVRAYNISSMNETLFRNIILMGLNRDIYSRPICIASEYQKPVIDGEGLDEYMSKNSDMLKDAVREATKPLAPVNGTAERVALMNGQLFSQQGAMVNAIGTLHEHRKNAFLLIGMGTGKTVISLSAVVNEAVARAQKLYPDKSIADIYREKLYSGFGWVMCPGQLCEKWVEEASRKWFGYGDNLIIDAKVISDFNDLVRVVEYENTEGRNAKGIRLYVISKEDMKLSYQYEPVPLSPKKGLVKQAVCKTCLEDGNLRPREMVNGKLDKKCRFCEGTEWVLHNPFIARGVNKGKERLNILKNWESKTDEERAEAKKDLEYMAWPKIDKSRYVDGMACPHCGELLLKNRVSTDEKESGKIYLTEFDFAHRTVANQYCMLCGQPLWGPNVRNIVTEHGRTAEVKSQESAWSSVTHYSTFARASRRSLFARNGHEAQALAVEKLDGDFPSDEKSLTISKAAGPRRVAMSQYIKQRCRKADFCILDEVHKYSGETGQGHAAHQLINASKKTLCLTGTIANGMASSLFNLLWYAEPSFMVSEGYKYADKQKFIKDFGTFEATYAADCSGDDVSYGTVVKSKQIGSKCEKAGLSPLLHLKLLGMSVFLDLDDFSSNGMGENGSMPEFTEITRFSKVDKAIEEEYNNGLDVFRAVIKRLGRKLLSKSYHYGLFYLDSPFDQEPILNPAAKDEVIYMPPQRTEAEFEALVGGLSNKERMFIDDIKERLDAGERCFVYAEQTGKKNVTPRLARIISKYCGLNPKQVSVITVATDVSKRVEWMRTQAEKNDVKVFIANPALVDTGIDFIFTGDNGKEYNYPNLFYFQLGTCLATMWQASRRAYRLNQKYACRVYYYAYEGTMQASILELMGLKEASVSAIQSRFSSSALAAMSADLDVRVKLAESLMKGKIASTEDIDKIFDSARSLQSEAKCIYDGYPPAKSYWELLGIEKPGTAEEHTPDLLDFLNNNNNENEETEVHEPEMTEIVIDEATETDVTSDDGGIEEFLSGLFAEIEYKPPVKKKKAAKKKVVITSDFDWGF